MTLSPPDTCGWTLQTGNDLVWRLGRNLSDGSGGFVVDHTYGNAAGDFLYTAQETSESSGPAVMTTKTLHNSFLECTMEFWYLLFIYNYLCFLKYPPMYFVPPFVLSSPGSFQSDLSVMW